MKTESNDTVFEAIGKFAILSIVAIMAFSVTWVYGVFAYGLVGSILWKWFIVPVFHLPILTWLQMSGVYSGLTFFTLNLKNFQISNKSSDELDTWSKVYNVAIVFILPWFFLLSGYILHLWIGH